MSALTALLALGAMFLYGFAMTNVSDMETAEKDNLLRLEFNVSGVRPQYDANDDLIVGADNSRMVIQVDTGVLAQSSVRYRIYETDELASGDIHNKTLCYSGRIAGSSDTEGYYEFATIVSTLVAATRTTVGALSQKHVFAADVLETNITVPAMTGGPDLQTTFNDHLAAFNTATLNNLNIDLTGVVAGPAVSVAVSIGPATTTAASNTAVSGNNAIISGGGKADAARCSNLNVRPEKAFYAMLSFHRLTTKPKPGSDNLVFTHVARSATQSLALVDQSVDVDCFIEQYRDDVGVLMMSFDNIKGYATAQLVISVVGFVAFCGVLFGFNGVTMSFKGWMGALILATGVYLTVFAFMLKANIGDVADGVKAAIPTTTECESEHISVVYDTDARTHAEDFYLGGAILTILATVAAIGSLMLKDTTQNMHSYFYRTTS